jgi:Dna[CI] antecedent, DciA
VRAELVRFGPQAGLAELVAAWPDAVGAAIARNAWPARIGRDGTVHVSTADSVWAFELTHRAAEIASRLRVPAVRFAPGPLPEPEPPADSGPAAPRPTPGQRRAAAELARPIGDPEVRESVQGAAASWLAWEAIRSTV